MENRNLTDKTENKSDTIWCGVSRKIHQEIQTKIILLSTIQKNNMLSISVVHSLYCFQKG